MPVLNGYETWRNHQTLLPKFYRLSPLRLLHTLRTSNLVMEEKLVSTDICRNHIQCPSVENATDSYYAKTYRIVIKGSNSPLERCSGNSSGHSSLCFTHTLSSLLVFEGVVVHMNDARFPKEMIQYALNGINADYYSTFVRKKWIRMSCLQQSVSPVDETPFHN